MDEYAVIVLHNIMLWVGLLVVVYVVHEMNTIFLNTFGWFAALYMSLTHICLFEGHTKEILNKFFY